MVKTDKELRPKLSEVMPAEASPGSVERAYAHLGLIPTESDPPDIGGFLCQAVGLVASESVPAFDPCDYIDADGKPMGILASQAFHDIMPSTLAGLAGKTHFTFREYLEELPKYGVDIEAMWSRVRKTTRDIEARQLDDRTRAEKCFLLLQERHFIRDEELRELIDGGSIYDLLELVLDHADTMRAKIKAGKRHAEHRAMKQDVFDWLDNNMQQFKSMDAAAEAIAGAVVPVTFRTVRDWVGEWKKLRSARRP